MTTKRKPGFHPGIPNAEYHKGLTQDPRPLSSTLAKNLLRALPAEAKWQLENPTHKDVYDEGQILHELILEGHLTTGIELKFDSYRTKAAKEARELARLDKKTPILTHKLEGLQKIADKVRADEDVIALLSTDGDAEISALTEIDGVPVQARYDYLRKPNDRYAGYILDLKTAATSAVPRDFNRNGAVYAYHLQAALYQEVLKTLTGVEVPYFWLVVSKDEPHAHSLIQASQTDLQTGRDLFWTALEKWEHILTNGWPQGTPIVESSFPAWTQFEVENIK